MVICAPHDPGADSSARSCKESEESGAAGLVHRCIPATGPFVLPARTPLCERPSAVMLPGCLDVGTPHLGEGQEGGWAFLCGGGGRDHGGGRGGGEEREQDAPHSSGWAPGMRSDRI